MLKRPSGNFDPMKEGDCVVDGLDHDLFFKKLQPPDSGYNFEDQDSSEATWRVGGRGTR